MTPTGLWLARLLPFLGIAAHIAAAVMMYRTGELVPGVWPLAFAWFGLILYGVVFHFRGDFIQRALNLGVKPGCGDELERDKARMAYTVAYIAMILTGSGVVAFNADYFFFSEVTDPAALAQAGRALFLEVLTVLYIGAVAPTLFLGWTMQALGGDAHSATGKEG